MAKAQLVVRNLDRKTVVALKRRATAHGRSAEEEHREILRRALGVPSGGFKTPERRDDLGRKPPF